MKKVAVVTGSNKGLGFAIVKELCKKFDGMVYLTSRDETRGRDAIEKLNNLELYPEYHQLDVSDKHSIEIFKNHLKETHGGIDILVNNAAIVEAAAITPCTYEEAKEVIDNNYKSILEIEALIYPLIRENGRILNISSNCGLLANLCNKHWIKRLSDQNLSVKDVNEFVNWFLQSKRDGSFKVEDFVDNATVAAYRVAKIAISAVTMIQQKNLDSRNISINSLHPGLVRTDMTKGSGFLNPDEAAETPLYLILEAPQNLKGAFVWHDKEIIDWYNIDSDRYFELKSLLGNLP